MAAASSSVRRHVALTGVPGVGKTTLVRSVCEVLAARGVSLAGFVTEELRSQGRRTGFDVVTLDGSRAPLARIGEGGRGPAGRGEPAGKSRHSHGGAPDVRVGQYVVDVRAFEQATLPVLRGGLGNTSRAGLRGGVHVVDEVGRMELMSQTFAAAVRTLFNSPQVVVLATIPVLKGRPLELVEHIRQRRDVTVFTVTRENRDMLHEEIVETIMKTLLV